MEGLFSSLGIEWGKILAQAINFGILAFVLFKLVYKPILKALDDREASAKKALENTSSIEEKLKEAEETSKKIIAEARTASQKMIKDTEKSAMSLKDKLSAEAKADAEKIMGSAEKKMEEERNKFLAQFEKSKETLENTSRVLTLKVENLDPKLLLEEDKVKFADEAYKFRDMQFEIADVVRKIEILDNFLNEFIKDYQEYTYFIWTQVEKAAKDQQAKANAAIIDYLRKTGLNENQQTST